MRIASPEWRRDRWFDGVLFALLVHAVAIAVLAIMAGPHATRVAHTRRATVGERLEQLRFSVPAVPAPVPRTLAHGGSPSRRHAAPIPPLVPSAPVQDTDASIASSPAEVPSPAATVAAAGLLAAPLLSDGRFLVGPAAASGVADARVRDANASIRSRLREVQDSIRRHNIGWTVGDSTHRFGVAPCGIRISKICIPFGFGSMPKPGSH